MTPRVPSAATKQTVVEDDTEFRGTLHSKCPVVVKGTVDGEIAGPSLHVSATGTVSGHVKVTELRSEGTVGGEFDAEIVHLAGTVKNNTIIKAKSLEVKLTPKDGRLQVTFGECELAIGEVPGVQDAVNSAIEAARPPAPAAAEKPDTEKPAGKEKAPAADEGATDIREAAAAAEGGEAEGGAGGKPARGGKRRDTSSPSPA
ncbi:MAG TPA: polymer-forming cytoskeletal protein [Kofleriaceae bacterium]|nr:polymer-forming cytoskeletal protein [Kofleriaceae bacterium]